MEEKKFTNDDVEKVMQGGFNSLGGSSSIWTYILLMLFMSSGKDNISKDEHIKMKEDIAELKGKMSMLEKFIQ